VAEERRIRVRIEQTAPVLAQVDAVRLGQAVNNLLDNALKYTPEGGNVILAVRSMPDGAELEVRDDGPGIPEAEREAVFRRLYRSDTSRSQRGLGLGLSMVKAIVEAHGGTVRATTAPEGGACLRVRLPGRSLTSA
jgi:signal transduction histidine kinase